MCVVLLLFRLDLSRDVSTHFLQHRLFVSQLELAARVQLPVIIYDKQATEKVVEIIQDMQAKGKKLPKFAIHAFNNTIDILNKYISIGTICHTVMLHITARNTFTHFTNTHS